MYTSSFWTLTETLHSDNLLAALYQIRSHTTRLLSARIHSFTTLRVILIKVNQLTQDILQRYNSLRMDQTFMQAFQFMHFQLTSVRLIFNASCCMLEHNNNYKTELPCQLLTGIRLLALRVCACHPLVTPSAYGYLTNRYNIFLL